MIIKFSVNDEQRQRRHSCEIDLKGYHMNDQVIRDLDHVIEFHKMQYDKFKQEYIEKYGEEWFNKSYCGD